MIRCNTRAWPHNLNVFTQSLAFHCHGHVPISPLEKTGLRLKSVVAGVMECTMQICLDQATQEGASSGTEGLATRGFKAILNEQWQGMAVGPTMKML